MASAFGKYLTELIKARKGASITWFAKALGKSQGNISNIIKGIEYSPPLDEIDDWLAILDRHTAVTKDQRRRFHDLACIAHIPHQVRPRFELWYEEHVSIGDELEKLRRQVRRVADGD